MNQNDNKHLYDKLDKIVTMLAKGETWHRKSANQCRKIGIRGVGELHDVEGMEDAIKLFEISKILNDKLHYNPKIDYQQVEKASIYTIDNHQDFKRHFSVWEEHENNFISLLLETLPHTILDLDLHQKVMKLTESVQNEKFRIENLKNSFEFAGWNAHDISVKSKWLCEYFQNNWKHGDEIDYNIG